MRLLRVITTGALISVFACVAPAAPPTGPVEGTLGAPVVENGKVIGGTIGGKSVHAPYVRERKEMIWTDAEHTIRVAIDNGSWTVEAKDADGAAVYTGTVTPRLTVVMTEGVAKSKQDKEVKSNIGIDWVRTYANGEGEAVPCI